MPKATQATQAAHSSSVRTSHTASTAKVCILNYPQKPYTAPARSRKSCGQDNPIFTCRLDNCQWSSTNQSTVSRHKWTHLPRSMHPRCDALNQHGNRCGRRRVAFHTHPKEFPLTGRQQILPPRRIQVALEEMSQGSGMGELPNQGEVHVPLARVLRTTRQTSNLHHALIVSSRSPGVSPSSGILNRWCIPTCTTSPQRSHPNCARAPCTSPSSDGTGRKQRGRR